MKGKIPANLLRSLIYLSGMSFTFGGDQPAPGQVRLVRNEYDGFLGDVLIGPEHLQHLLRHAEAAPVRGRIDDAVTVRIVVGQALIRL